MGNYNHTQLEELHMSKKELWDRKVGRNKLNPVGIETSLGHAYSIILEELTEQGKDCQPNPDEFLDFIRNNLRNSGNGYKAHEVEMLAPCWDPDHTTPIVLYMKEKGLNSSSCTKIMKDIVGPEFCYRDLY